MMTNLDEIFSSITSIGQHPDVYTDAYILLEQMGHRQMKWNECIKLQKRKRINWTR